MFLKKDSSKSIERLKKALGIKGVKKEYEILREGEEIINNSYELFLLRENTDKTWDVFYRERGQESIIAKFHSSGSAKQYFFWLLQDLESPWDVADLD